MKQLRISSPLNLHAYPKDNMSEYIKAGLVFHKEMGFDAADFSMGLLDLTNDRWHPRAEQAIADSEEIGVRFEICHLPFIGGGAKPDPAFLAAFNEKMHRAIDAAALLGVKYAVLHPNAPTLPMKSYDQKEQYRTVRSHLAPFAEHAARVGVRLALENMRVIPTFMACHRFGQSPDELCQIVDELGMDVCWDFGHANISGVKQSEGLACVGKRLKVIHINDNGAVDDEHIPPFMGNVDWRDAMHGLALAEFDGVMNFELSVGKVPASLRASYAKYVVDAAHELMSYIE